MLYGYRDSFIVYVKTDNILKGIGEDVETRFNTSNFEIDRPLPERKNEKVIGLMKDKLGGHDERIYWINSKNTLLFKRQQKKYIIKRKLKFEDYKNSFEEAKIENNINHLEKIKLM